ncbi:FtsL-like putative cell division protein [Eisenibacter elegans]|jgi:hypothetical protein|uniref:FtsL-like putative cell division protein n=1 Tax=Eisenibacter elegans TaxID=997 RepID=UPI000416B7C2|nr:FtsL-like putative cell division protein [Eisenibacter elegans]
MAENSYRNAPKGNAQRQNRPVKAVRSLFDNFINLDAMIDQGLPTRYIPHLLFLGVLGIIYVGNTHQAEKMGRQLNQLERKVETLRADYTTSKIEFLQRSKQSEIMESAQELGLVENDGKTYRIVLEK